MKKIQMDWKLKLYILLGGKLIYSEVEPTVYRLEIK
ncbi:capsid protein [Bacillus cereus]|nr:capsid protein [Bacillus cereus]